MRFSSGTIHFFVVLILLSSGSCKDAIDKNIAEDDEVKTLVGKEKAATAVEEVSGILKEFFSILKFRYEKRIDRMPTKAESSFTPYSGGYYPESTGGTNIRGALGRYDQAFRSTAAAWEQNNHAPHSGYTPPGWAGHCNGFGASSSRHIEPTKSVTKNGVTFTAKDIKAMMAEIYMSAKPIKLGGARCEQESPGVDPFQRPNKERMGDCEDVNPASFHMALTNIIGGPKKIPMVMDFSQNYQIWNYPVYAYRCDNCVNINGQTVWKKLTGANPAQEAIRIISGGASSATSYVFNRGAVAFYDVKLTINHSNAFKDECLSCQQAIPKTYRYVLEINDRGEVIGGEWALESRDKHPDFVWFALDSAGGNGDRRFANPRLNPKNVKDLWRESLKNAGILNPYEGEEEPVWETDWGRYTDFEVEIDGSQSGAVFLGKRTKLIVTPKTKKYDSAKVELILNGETAKSFRVSGKNKLLYEFDAIPGMNDMRLEWTKGGSTDTTFLRFYAIP